MSAIEEAELRQLNADREFSKLAISESANNFVREIQNGLGEEILEELNRKPVEKTGIRKFLERLLNVI